MWHEVASQNLAFLDGCTCSKYEYHMTSDHTFDDRFTCTKNGKANAMDLTLKGIIPDLSVPAKQAESPLVSWLPTAPYWVLEVGSDYEYAVVYACVNVYVTAPLEYIYIFHRKADGLASLDLDGIKGRLSAQGIDVSGIKVVPCQEVEQ